MICVFLVKKCEKSKLYSNVFQNKCKFSYQGSISLIFRAEMFYLEFDFVFLFSKSADKYLQVYSSWKNSENNVLTQKIWNLKFVTLCDLIVLIGW